MIVTGAAARVRCASGFVSAEIGEGLPRGDLVVARELGGLTGRVDDAWQILRRVCPAAAERREVSDGQCVTA